MGTYIALLLLVVPGFIARKIYKQTNNIREDLGQWEESLYCLFYSLVLAVVAMALTGALQMNTIPQWEQLFTSMAFCIKYTAVVGVGSVVLGLLTRPLLTGYTWIINKLRRKQDGQIAISTTIFDELFHDGHRHLVEVYKDDKFICRGELVESIERYKEYYIKDCMEEYQELLQALQCSALPYVGTYIDGKTGFVIKELLTDPNALQAWAASPHS